MPPSPIDKQFTYNGWYPKPDAPTTPRNIAFVCDGASGDPELEYLAAHAFLNCFQLWKERHRKYGPGNIAAFGAAGCLVRASDKEARLRRKYFDNVPDNFDDESVYDAWKDLANYAIMGLMWELGDWPGSPQPKKGEI